MKKLIIILLLSLFFKTYAQDFTIVQLQEYNKISFDDFKVVVKNKGFTFHDKTEVGTFKMFEYQKFENDVGYEIAKTIDDENSLTSITYETSNKNEFDLLLSSAKKLGYKLIEKGEAFGESYELFKLNNLKMQFNFPDPNDKNLKSYGITVYK